MTCGFIKEQDVPS